MNAVENDILSAQNILKLFDVLLLLNHPWGYAMLHRKSRGAGGLAGNDGLLKETHVRGAVGGTMGRPSDMCSALK